METVCSNGDYLVTSRYRVAGHQLSAISRQTLGLGHAAQGLLIAAVVALSLALVLGRLARRGDGTHA